MPLRLRVVRAEGVEPPRLSTLEPKSSASTSSATRANRPRGYSKDRRGSKRMWQPEMPAGVRILEKGPHLAARTPDDPSYARFARHTAAGSAAAIATRAAHPGAGRNSFTSAGYRCAAADPDGAAVDADGTDRLRPGRKAAEDQVHRFFRCEADCRPGHDIAGEVLASEHLQTRDAACGGQRCAIWTRIFAS